MDYWVAHPGFLGFLLLLSFAFFPRLTLLFAAVWGGVLWWLGLIFLPRITVAIIATMMYWDTNVVLCVLAWIVALGGESSEKESIRRHS